MTVRQHHTLVRSLPTHRQHRLRSPCQLPRVRRRVRWPSQPARVSVQHHAHRRLHPHLRRRRLALSPPTPSPHPQLLQSLTHRPQLRAHPHARPQLSTPHRLSFPRPRSSQTGPTPFFSPLQSRTAVPSSRSRPAPMTVRQQRTFVTRLPHHRQHRLRSPWPPSRVRRRPK